MHPFNEDGRLHGVFHGLRGPVEEDARVPPAGEDQGGEAADRRHRAARPVGSRFVERRTERGEHHFEVKTLSY